MDITSVDTATPHRGGTLRYATIGKPPTLDMMATILIVSVDVTSSIYEGRFSVDSHFTLQPMLAQTFNTKDQGQSFNNPSVRQAAMAALNLPAFLQTQVGIPGKSHTCFSVYRCNTVYFTTKGMNSNIAGGE